MRRWRARWLNRAIPIRRASVTGSSFKERGFADGSQFFAADVFNRSHLVITAGMAGRREAILDGPLAPEEQAHVFGGSASASFCDFDHPLPDLTPGTPESMVSGDAAHQYILVDRAFGFDDVVDHRRQTLRILVGMEQVWIGPMACVIKTGGDVLGPGGAEQVVGSLR